MGHVSDIVGKKRGEDCMENEEILESADAEEINRSIASVMRNIRKRRGLTQAMISEMSGVSVGSVKRFEKTGNISLTSFSKLALALGLKQELTELFREARFRVP